MHLNSAYGELNPPKSLIQSTFSSVSRPPFSWPFFYFNLQNEMDLKIMVTITKGTFTASGKIPVTLLVDDVETANELIKLAKAANVPVVEQEEDISKAAINPVFKYLDRIASKK
ncbi:hypothetical protein WDR87_001144 [Klebsiella quasipneumoniae]